MQAFRRVSAFLRFVQDVLTEIIERKYKLEDVGTRYIQTILDMVKPQLGTEIRIAWHKAMLKETLCCPLTST